MPPGAMGLDVFSNVDEFLDTCAPLFVAHAAELGLPCDLDRDWARGLPNCRCFVWWHAGAPAGYLVVHGEVNPITGLRCGILDAVFVPREHRRRGFGMALLAQARRWARAEGYQRLVCAAPAGGALHRILGRSWTMTEAVFEVDIDGH